MSIKQKIIRILEEEGPLTKEQLYKRLQVDGATEKSMKALCKEMIRDGEIYKDSEKKFSAPGTGYLLEGILRGNEKGFGFFIPDDENREDLYIHSTKMNTAMNGDRILVRQVESKGPKGGYEGIVEKVLERANKVVVGTYNHAGKFGFVLPDDGKLSSDIYIRKKYNKGAKEGQKVVAEIIEYPTPTTKPEGIITEILGYPHEKNVDVLSVAYGLGIELEFPPEVLKEAELIPEVVSEVQIRGRRDLRELVTFTIDGADSKDFDDALSIEKVAGGYLVGVHIADVAEYVPLGSPLDLEARERGNSVYLLNKVIPMLPQELSNGICSLNEGADRLTLSLLARVGEDGRVESFELVEGVIRSHRRLIYDHVTEFLEGGSTHESLRGLEKDLSLLHELAQKRKALRRERGNIDFTFPEAEIQLDDNGRPIHIGLRSMGVANELIEEFMLMANELVAKRYFEKELPFLYRIHEEPSPDKIELLNSIIRPFGHRISTTKDITPKMIQQLTEKVRGKKEETLVSTLILRSMQKARYSYALDQHFGLAAPYYSHFTSPIRRYSDLTIHRVIKGDLNGQLTPKLLKHYHRDFPKIAEHVSATEKVAQEAERSVDDIKMAEYMSERIGELFEGRISGITGFGIFVALPNTIEGLVSYNSMDDFYHFDEDNYRAVGEHTKKVYTMGDPVQVVCVGADPIKGQIDFQMAGDVKDEEKQAGNSGAK
ncbi:MAG: ribonuclease R [Tissierellia bacterium]|nr:ribonuclease R [Tissierellia bacterium]